MPISLNANVAVSSGISHKSADRRQDISHLAGNRDISLGLRKLLVYRAWALIVRAIMGPPSQKVELISYD
jgi:hypothetical protein